MITILLYLLWVLIVTGRGWTSVQATSVFSHTSARRWSNATADLTQLSVCAGNSTQGHSRNHTSGAGSKLCVIQVESYGKRHFQPRSVNAAPGDIIFFHFLTSGNILAKSSLDYPCSPLPASQWIGSTNSSTGSTIAYSVDTEDATWLYYTQNQSIPHCDAGMVFSINPGKDLLKFEKNAANQSIPSSDLDDHSDNGTKPVCTQYCSHCSPFPNGTSSTTTGVSTATPFRPSALASATSAVSEGQVIRLLESWWILLLSITIARFMI